MGWSNLGKFSVSMLERSCGLTGVDPLVLVAQRRRAGYLPKYREDSTTVPSRSDVDLLDRLARVEGDDGQGKVAVEEERLAEGQS